MSDVKRSVRVASEVSFALAQVLREGVKDPRVTPITITSVRLSDDLSVARVNFVPLGGTGDAEAIVAGLESARGYLRREVGRRVRLRYVPELRFHIDEHLEQAIGMTALLDQLTAARAEEE